MSEHTARCDFVSMGMRCVLIQHDGHGHCPSICPGGPCGLCAARTVAVAPTDRVSRLRHLSSRDRNQEDHSG